MKEVTLYRDDYRDSGWFYILQGLGVIDKEVCFGDIFDSYGEFITDEYDELFDSANVIELEVNNFNLIK